MPFGWSQIWEQSYRSSRILLPLCSHPSPTDPSPTVLPPISHGAPTHGSWVAGSFSPLPDAGIKNLGCTLGSGIDNFNGCFTSCKAGSEKSPLPALGANQTLYHYLSWSMPNPMLNGLPCFLELISFKSTTVFPGILTRKYHGHLPSLVNHYMLGKLQDLTHSLPPTRMS